MPRNYTSSLDDIPEPFCNRTQNTKPDTKPAKTGDMLFILLVIMVFYG